MKDIKEQKGFVGTDIAIAVIIIFIFTTMIAVLIAKTNSSSQEIELHSEATYIAVDEIEKIKADTFSKYEGVYFDPNNPDATQQYNDGTPIPRQEKVKEGFYKTIIVEDYADIKGPDGYVTDLVKKITVKISYMFKGKVESVEISTLLTKE